ncbi:GMC family oxidoreductase [Granulicella cerasi]|uniref:GMC family oxidoreductase n=1 Tax=Granulicella cerasi TaxID=741063 RepID=A0ABW1ZDM9_9BACT|nr:GMC family oxidoreductase [Granulicella cerasi]
MNRLGSLRASMQRFTTAEEVDAVVIGTGAGGAPLLAKLANKGLRVVALEAGPWFESPADEFATDEVDAAKIYWTDERLSAGETPLVFGANNSGTGVGGSTLHWGAFVPRANPDDMRLRSDTGEGVDWPIRYAELEPYYREVEEFIGVSGPESYPWDATRHYPLGPIAINKPGVFMQRGFAALGLRTAAAPIAAVSERYERPEYGAREACVNRGFCHQGCRNGAKASMDVTYLPWAVERGAEIRERCFVHGFERDDAGRITAVLYRDLRSGQAIETRQRCKAVFLCAGGVESARLLLHAEIANGSGEVGKNFTAHVATQVWGTFGERVKMNIGFPATVISEDLLRPKDANFAGGYLVQSLGVVPVTWAQSVARGRGLFGAALQSYLDQYNFVAGIGINGDCLPSAKNYLELSDEVDHSGLKKPRVFFSYGKNELAMEQHATRVMTEAWQAAGASDIWSLRRTAHIIGTCRMGTDANQSVVDPHGRSHEVENLWICDNSVFPSALAANPALTIMALSLRTADAFLRGV